jgi:hypothetical protein
VWIPADVASIGFAPCSPKPDVSSPAVVSRAPAILGFALVHGRSLARINVDSMGRPKQWPLWPQPRRGG